MTEADFIAALRALPLHAGAEALADDAAFLPPDLVLTTDSIAEGVHYLPGTTPQDVAWRLVATNLSDLAAKGARPDGVLLNYPLGDDAWDRAFVAGLREVLARFDCALLGGDTVRLIAGAPRTISLTAIGRASHLPIPRRSGARAGDSIWVAGAIGDAMLGHRLVAAGDLQPGALVAAYLRPQPLVAQGIALAPLVSAMMDVSDGLLIDAARIATASGVTMAIERARVPLSPTFRRVAQGDDAEAALRWGDDYALLFTLPADRHPPVPATMIGRVEASGRFPVTLDGEAPAGALGYQH
ncbi:thiamine-phosphate kinase [Sphingomonas sp. SFZ2018-12]|uniref:thiamine-phosphate kinase n=1 Tax=Sphingomonas sp. SFZ2018-12 TaxID=2683197 RepID=UPI001F113591|nr:thiamine-phosphate kinase [Sphingomonas sp. SFZ2018-12]MCH4893190.1 thiamine-phosphate kinase [Sphingomonas sp. SFZ2018-12]